ncbi:helix-turn-helix domain-containing protein [Kitasatospora sp. NPDC058965]|uniref:PucR family transcriptional regulator n=1 Tax=Kitasatospora sp. NPDC058965 TaxID=3346682 RepID=UPI00367CE95A
MAAAPWNALPRNLAGELRGENRAIAAEIIREIRGQVPEFARPLAGKFGAGIQQGVETALEEFVDLVSGVEAGGPERLRVYRALGRGELAEGRSLDALQAAYRLGARVAWRRYARVARRAGLGTEVVVALAEAVFAHIDEMAAASVQGYAEHQADRAGALGRQRLLLLHLLVGGAEPATVAQAAELAGWPLPDRLACVALGSSRAGPAPGRPQRERLPAGVLAELEGAEPFLLVPEPALTLREEAVRQVLADRGAVIGPTVTAGQAADSLRWARAVRARLGEAGALAAAPVDCDDRLAELLLLGDAALVRLVTTRRLAPLDGLTAKQGARLADTLLAFLQSGRGTAPEVAARLGVHPQTARQRLHQVHRLFGPALVDPDARFELEVALRARALRPGGPPGR